MSSNTTQAEDNDTQNRLGIASGRRRELTANYKLCALAQVYKDFNLGLHVPKPITRIEACLAKIHPNPYVHGYALGHYAFTKRM